MSDTGKFKKLDHVPALDKHEDGSSTEHGRIRFDDRGNAVWEPYGEVDAGDTMTMLLHGSGLAISDDATHRGIRRVEPNPTGVKKGYDPYDSGLLASKERKKKKDLRALSKWIEQKKKLERDR